MGILSENIVVVHSWSAIIMCLTAFFITAVLVGGSILEENHHAAIIFSVITIIVAYALVLHVADAETYVEYEIEVSAETELTDFLSKYEVLERDGNVFTVKGVKE